MSRFTIPTHLKHKPVLYIDDYEKIDGQYKNNTDVEFLSLGRAQWGDGKFVASVKVMRNVGGKWSRQSEETTVTRAMDLALLAIEGYRRYVEGKASRPVNSVFGTELSIQECTDVEPGIVNELQKYYENNRNDITAHMRLLRDLLNKCDLD